MTGEQTDKQRPKPETSGYQLIVDDIEEKYIYLMWQGGNRRAAPRAEILEMINSGKTVPLLEIREKH